MDARRLRCGAGLLAAGATLAVFSICTGEAAAQAQTEARAPVASRVLPQRETLLKLMRPMSVSFQGERLEDVVAFIRNFTGAEIEALWMDSTHPDGLDPETPVTLRADNLPVLTVLERILDQAQRDFTQNTWQMARTGEIQIGPKDRLNRFRRVEVYDINDLLVEIPDYPEVPRIDLQSVLQSQQGGGGQSPFTEQEDQTTEDRRRLRETRAEDIMDILLNLVEPEQWIENGGTGGSIRYYQGHLIVNAPDYMHRQINGYPYWPQRLTSAAVVNGRRYVTLGTDTGISTIDGFGQVPVTAVVGGQLIQSNEPGGGG